MSARRCVPFLRLACLVSLATGCTVFETNKLQVAGLKENPEYNGEYLRERDVHQHPSFWQKAPQNSCGKAMRKGGCGALHWQTLPAGNASEDACLKACEAEKQYGCCRFGSSASHADAAAFSVRFAGAAAPAGCALGHGNVVFEAAPIMATVASCHGQALVMHQDGAWTLARPHLVGDVTLDSEELPRYVIIAKGPINQSLSSGFSGEVAGVSLVQKNFVASEAQVQLHCEEEEEGLSKWMVVIPVVVVVLCMCVALISCCFLPKKARATTAVPRPVPEMQENPIDDWDTMLGRSQASGGPASV